MYASLRQAALAAALSCVGVAAQAVAAALPPLQLSMQLGDGSVRPVELRFVQDGEITRFSSGDLLLAGDGSVVPSCITVVCDGSVRIEGSYKVDPFINFSVALTDFGAASLFTFSFVSPTLGGPWNAATNQLSGSFRSAVDDLSLLAGYGVDNASLAYDTDLELGPTDCTSDVGCLALGSVSKAGNFPAGVMGSQLRLMGSGAGATYTFNSHFELLNARVPEPAPAALLALSLVVLAQLRRRARR